MGVKSVFDRDLLRPFRTPFDYVTQLINVSVTCLLMVDMTEIVDFCDFLSPTLEEQAARDTAVECVFDVIKHIWPHSKVCLSVTLCRPNPPLLFINLFL